MTFLVTLCGWKNTYAVIYGENSVTELDQIHDVKVQKVAKAVAGVFTYYRSIQNTIDLLYKNPRNLTDKMTCEDELFTNQPLEPVATAFLIAPDKVMTVGHALSSCSKVFFVFNYEWDSLANKLKPITSQDVYGCDHIEQLSYSKIDFAIIQLDRRVEGIEPLELDFKTSIQEKDKIFTVGHPLQLPKKYADGLIRSTTGLNGNYYKAEIDTFRGNSGSPVFSKESFQVIGIVKDGEYDFTLDEDKFCNYFKRCPTGTCRGEDITRMDKIKSFLH